MSPQYSRGLSQILNHCVKYYSEKLDKVTYEVTISTPIWEILVLRIITNFLTFSIYRMNLLLKLEKNIPPRVPTFKKL